MFHDLFDTGLRELVAHWYDCMPSQPNADFCGKVFHTRRQTDSYERVGRQLQTSRIAHNPTCHHIQLFVGGFPFTGIINDSNLLRTSLKRVY